MDDGEYEGDIYIVDAFGTFEQNQEVSYDIMGDMGNEKRLFKHIREGERWLIQIN